MASSYRSEMQSEDGFLVLVTSVPVPPSKETMLYFGNMIIFLNPWWCFGFWVKRSLAAFSPFTELKRKSPSCDFIYSSKCPSTYHFCRNIQ